MENLWLSDPKPVTALCQDAITSTMTITVADAAPFPVLRSPVDDDDGSPDSYDGESPRLKGKDDCDFHATTAANSVPTANGGPQPNCTSNNNFIPKTDKPRPHRCGTCDRSFARLEHLKRHERSHTKEKPFGCSECQRCFARRDLLLRHQQKLHASATTSSRSRIRRESTGTAVVPASRARKNSIVTSPHVAAPMRPRANTISHIDGQTVQVAVGRAEASRPRHGAHVRHPSLSGLPHMDHTHTHVITGMAAALNHRGVSHALPKLDTHAMPQNPLPYDAFGSLRTAPLLNFFDIGLGDSGLFSASTINPNALHFNDSPQPLGMDMMTQFTDPGVASVTQTSDDQYVYDWMYNFDSHLSISNPEPGPDGSSPSAVSTNSKDSGLSELMLDGSNQHAGASSMWSAASIIGPPHLANFPLDFGSASFTDMLNLNALSPQVSEQHAGDSSSRGSSDPLVFTGLKPH